MADRGRLYVWGRNRGFGDGKQRPVLVISPDVATAIRQSADLVARGHPGQWPETDRFCDDLVTRALDLRMEEPWIQDD
jgi:hypothetical protein